MSRKFKFVLTLEEFEKNNSEKDIITSKNLTVKNTKYKGILYHGTNIEPDKFELSADYDGDSGNVYMTDVPEGVVFLTNDIKEAKTYGQYVIPCEVKVKNILVIKVYNDKPSIEFDDDYSGYSNYGMWSRFITEDAYDMLEVRGLNKSTFIVYPELVVPRIDLLKI